jgi:hypothetical protein
LPGREVVGRSRHHPHAEVVNWRKVVEFREQSRGFFGAMLSDGAIFKVEHFFNDEATRGAGDVGCRKWSLEEARAVYEIKVSWKEGAEAPLFTK